MSGTIAGGYFKDKNYSCMYFNENKYDYVSHDGRYYFVEGISEHFDGNDKPAFLVFAMNTDALVFADEIFPQSNIDRYIHWTIDDLDKMEKIRKYTGEEKISDLSYEEKVILDEAITEDLRKKHEPEYLSGKRDLSWDTKAALEGKLKDLSFDWKETLEEVYADIIELKYREDILDLIKTDGHDFLKDLDKHELDEVITYAACLVDRLEKKDSYESKLEVALADAHYGYTSAKDMEELEVEK